MKRNKKPTSFIRIYVVQYLMFLVGSIFFIYGIVRVANLPENETNLNVIDAIAWVELLSGAFLIGASYIYARRGAKIIGKACPMCYGTGYVDVGRGQNKGTQICTVCSGTGKLLDKAQVEWEKEKRRLEREREKQERQKNEEIEKDEKEEK